MKKQTIIIIFLLLPFLLLSSSFYTNLAEEGKKLYLSGKYEEAIENFRIAEFGLMENKTVLKDLYLYYALAHFKLSHGDEVMKLANKLKGLGGVTTFQGMKVPDEIAGDLDSLFSIIDKSYKTESKDKTGKKEFKKVKPGIKKSEEYNEVYNSIRESLKGNDLPAVKSGLKRLKKLGRRDIRTRHVSGIVYFRDNNYKKAVSELLLVNKTGSDELIDESSYYLALSNYFLKSYGQFLAFAQKVNDGETRGKLKEIRKKVQNLRETGIKSIKTKFFNKKGFIQFISAFNGDITLASDILSEVENIVPLRGRDVYYMADAAIKYPGIYNKKFVLNLITFFSDREEEEFAEKIVKGSKFYKMDNPDNIEILYNLGLLYYKIGNIKKMKKMMLRVKSIDPGYKKVNFYLTK